MHFPVADFLNSFFLLSSLSRLKKQPWHHGMIGWESLQMWMVTQGTPLIQMQSGFLQPCAYSKIQKKQRNVIHSIWKYGFCPALGQRQVGLGQSICRSVNGANSGLAQHTTALECSEMFSFYLGIRVKRKHVPRLNSEFQSHSVTPDRPRTANLYGKTERGEVEREIEYGRQVRS